MMFVNESGVFSSRFYFFFANFGSENMSVATIHSRVLGPSQYTLSTMKRLRKLRVLDVRNRHLAKLVGVTSLEEL